MATVAVACPRGNRRRDLLLLARHGHCETFVFGLGGGGVEQHGRAPRYDCAMELAGGGWLPWSSASSAEAGGVSVAAIPLLLRQWPIVGNRSMAADSS